MERITKQSRRVVIAVVGGIVLIVGIIAIPYPGPGILIVISGLAILSTEFSWAKRALDFVKHHYDLWTAWVKRQPLMIRLGLLLVTGLVVVTTMWLLNVFGILDNFFSLGFNWVHSPILN